MRPGDRLICALVEAKPVGHKFRAWPLHITIIPWFRLGFNSGELAAELKNCYVGSQAFTVKVGGEKHFGYKQRKQVNLVEAGELNRLEGQTRRCLHKHKAWVVDEADKTRRHFRPHITVQQAGRLTEGEDFRCDRLFVVCQHGGYKQIEAEIIL